MKDKIKTYSRDYKLKLVELCKSRGNVSAVSREYGVTINSLNRYDRKVVGWAMSKTMTAKQTVIAAWSMAMINRPLSENLIFHSDRGVQYACDEFAGMLNKHQFATRSMSHKGDCWDNAVAESFFKSLKAEEVYETVY